MAKRRTKRAENAEVEGGDSQPTDLELVRAEIDRIRARFGVDPALPRRMLAGAWSAPSGAIEEDEAELVDALADCLSVGLHLGDAVVSWSIGGLARSDDGEEEPDLLPRSDERSARRLLARHAASPRG